MASLKVFISSTCYDLNVVRSQLRDFVLSFGFDPIMSDYSDVPYDPRNHTHVSCINEVEHCDMLIVIIGARFGGTAIPQAREIIDLDSLKTLSKGKRFLEECEEMSITQLEVLRAVELGIPVFPFVQRDVMHDHNLYEKNKEKTEIIDLIEFPSIQKQGTANYIFEFINFLRLRAKNNGIEGFSKVDEINSHLRKQWSGLFQRLLYEQKFNKIEERGFESLTSQMEDLKTALLSSIQNPELKAVAKGAVKYRQLIDFLILLSKNDKETLLLDISYSNLLEKVGVEEIREASEYEEGIDYLDVKSIKDFRKTPNYLIVMKDDRIFGVRPKINLVMEDMKKYWEDYRKESVATKTTLIEAHSPLDDFKISWMWLIGRRSQEIKDSDLLFRATRNSNVKSKGTESL